MLGKFYKKLKLRNWIILIKLKKFFFVSLNLSYINFKQEFIILIRYALLCYSHIKHNVAKQNGLSHVMTV